MRTPRSAAAFEDRYRPVKHFISENSADCGLCLGQRHFRFQAANNCQPPENRFILAILPTRRIADSRAIGERNPNVVAASRRDSGEARFGYADDGKRNIVQLDGAADDVARAAECALPVSIIQYGDRRCRWRIIGLLQDAPRGSLYTQNTEEISGDDLAVDDAGGAVASEIEAACVGERGRSREDLCFFNLAEHWLRERASRWI